MSTPPDKPSSKPTPVVCSSRPSTKGCTSNRRGGAGGVAKRRWPNRDTKPLTPRGVATQRSTSARPTMSRRMLKPHTVSSPGDDAEAHLRKRNAKLRGPAVARHLRLHFPHRVVVGAGAGVVEPRHVALHAGRVDVEGVGREVIVTRIETDPDPVAARAGVAPAERRRDLRHVGHVAAHRHVDGRGRRTRPASRSARWAASCCRGPAGPGPRRDPPRPRSRRPTCRRCAGPCRPPGTRAGPCPFSPERQARPATGATAKRPGWPASTAPEPGRTGDRADTNDAPWVEFLAHLDTRSAFSAVV